MHTRDDTEARLRRDAQAGRRAAQPGATLHHHIMARLSMAPPARRAVRVQTQVLVAVALLVAVAGGVYLGAHNLAPTPATYGPTLSS